MFKYEAVRINSAPRHNSSSPSRLVEEVSTTGFLRYNNALSHQHIDDSTTKTLKATTNMPISMGPESKLGNLSKDRSVFLIRGADIPRYLDQTTEHSS